ncbi:MAG: cytochrome b [Ruegeria sp.]|uniref:cytochrome b n=1 Tax=Ruegeria sp. TaxID=1879320 RepID=UPI00349ED534
MERYAFSARVLHWLMAAGFIFMWACGYAMTSLVPDDSPIEEFLFALHISIGVTLLALLVLRIAIRMISTPPPLPALMPKWEKIGSHVGHFGLYLLPAAVILVGWAEIDFGGHGAKWFGLSLPKVFPTVKTLWGLNLEDAMESLHRWLAYAMLALTVVHVAAVIKHRWIDGHDVLGRMTFGGRRKD